MNSSLIVSMELYQAFILKFCVKHTRIVEQNALFGGCYNIEDFNEGKKKKIDIPLSFLVFGIPKFI